MVQSQLCQTEDDIRALIALHLPELVREKQEVRVVRKVGVPGVVGAVESYIPRGDARYDKEDQDALFIETGSNQGYVFSIPEIATLEVLPTRRLTPELAYRQMKEMERAGGVKD